MPFRPAAASAWRVRAAPTFRALAMAKARAYRRPWEGRALLKVVDKIAERGATNGPRRGETGGTVGTDGTPGTLGTGGTLGTDAPAWTCITP